MDLEEQAGRQGQELTEIHVRFLARPQASRDFEEQAGRQGQEVTEIRNFIIAQEKPAERSAGFLHEGRVVGWLENAVQGI
ncbi:hypothetical protein [Mesorhizobium sp.]|uniref:hypothetical protein n=1 Tax=Mesorhizobium sp. TaxID=1871066 RepID=UPI000FE7A570|nr:hypothetical protein [Mesorhizobium sp.]RWP23190.1 MAG: hypothetical protein EOR01_10215 [Mesorhizobium sp.]RWP32786.1 MAG: hypothetical protein EOR02_05410 [Mesorhizobium sp.]RWQ29067.1 MAG: hypothetical protein EOS19_12605 [Mesorhizobium sp.]